ncbi:MAG: GvpL/GvpF family gas vesicle protein [Gemmatimonadaceae bacterium]
MSSACYVYAIVDRGTPLPPAAAGDGVAELAMVPCRELAAVTGRVEDGGARLSMANVLRHEAVVEAARRQGPALPVRFGTVFPDAGSVASALAERYEPLAADLVRLGDKVEMSLTALWATTPSDDGPALTPREARAPAERGEGARYLYARAVETRRDDALRERARAVARDVDRELGELALERRVSLLPTPRVAVRTAYLLDPGEVSAFRAAIESIRTRRDDLRILLTGPWPPYGFVRRAGADGGADSDGRLAALVELLAEVSRPG